jgi:hypothetical protein
MGGKDGVEEHLLHGRPHDGAGGAVSIFSMAFSRWWRVVLEKVLVDGANGGDVNGVQFAVKHPAQVGSG